MRLAAMVAVVLVPAAALLTIRLLPTKLSDGAALAAVLSALDAKNSFDLDRWLAAHEGGERRGVPLFVAQILMNAEQQWGIVEPCQVTGERHQVKPWSHA